MRAHSVLRTTLAVLFLSAAALGQTPPQPMSAVLQDGNLLLSASVPETVTDTSNGSAALQLPPDNRTALLPYTVENHTLHATVPSGQLGRVATGPETLILTLHGPQSDIAFAAHWVQTHPEPLPAPWYASIRWLPYAPWLALIALAFGLTGTVLALLWRPRPRSTGTSLREQVAHLQQELDQLKQEKRLPAITPFSALRDPGDTNALRTRLDAAEAQGRRLGEQLVLLQNQVAQPNAQLLTLQQDFDQFAEAAQAGTGATSAGANGGWGMTPDGAAKSLAAVVNRWLEEGARDRPALLSLCKELGLGGAGLASIREPAPAALPTGEFQCAFDPSDDGSWLLMKLPGTDDVLAAPADVQFMGMGAIPYQLDLMFDGMQGARSGFRFESILSPCILRASRGGYLISQRGTLRLQGGPSSTGPQPPTFATLLRNRPAARPESRTAPGAGLARWAREMGRRMDDYGVELGQVQEQLTVPGVTRAELQRVLEALTQQEAELNALRASLAATPRPPTPNPEPPSPTSPPVPVATAYALPPDWQKVVRSAAALPDSEPAVVDVPSPELYVRRTQNLATRMSAAHPEISVAVVHAKKGSASAQVELHATQRLASGKVRCQICSSEHTWQLAVAGGAADADVFLLFPSGMLSRSNFAPGYAVLVEDTGAATFDAATLTPAQLRREAGAEGFTYTTWQKMTPLPTVTGDRR